MEYIGLLVSFCVLLTGSFFDCKTKKLPVALLFGGLAGGILCFIGNLFWGGGIFLFSEAIAHFLLSLLPGVSLLVLSFLTERKVGAGDGIILLIIGLCESGNTVWGLLCLGLFFQSLFAVLLLLLRKAKKNTMIPFVPFLLGARICMLIF